MAILNNPMGALAAVNRASGALGFTKASCPTMSSRSGPVVTSALIHGSAPGGNDSVEVPPPPATATGLGPDSGEIYKAVKGCPDVMFSVLRAQDVCRQLAADIAGLYSWAGCGDSCACSGHITDLTVNEDCSYSGTCTITCQGCQC